MKRRWISGGTRDGQRIAFESEPPQTIVLDGEGYRLAGRGQFSSYVATRRRRGTAFTAERKRELLEHVAAGETIGRACELVGVSSACVYRHRHIDLDFGRELERARRRFAARRRLGGPARAELAAHPSSA